MALTYTYSNEDSNLETQILPERANNVAVVSGSGSRVLPLLAKSPRQINCVDLSVEQLWITELRLEALSSLDYLEFTKLLGYTNCEIDERKEIFSGLQLSNDSKKFLKNLFEKNKWDSIIFSGDWERAMRRFSIVAKFVAGDDFLGIFGCSTLEEQRTFLKRRMSGARWYSLISIFSLAAISHPNNWSSKRKIKNIPQSYFSHFREHFKNSFTQVLAKESCYLKLIFNMGIEDPNSWPCEAQEKNFSKMKSGLKNCSVKLTLGEISESIVRSGNTYDFLSFSNVPSLYRGRMESRFLQIIRGQISGNGIVVTRNRLYVPFRVQTIGYENVTEAYCKEIEKEATQAYYVDVYKRIL